jgi:hypothetical protein
MLARRRAFRETGGGRAVEIERAIYRRVMHSWFVQCRAQALKCLANRKRRRTNGRARLKDEMNWSRSSTAGRVFNTNDCSAAWRPKRASRGSGIIRACPAPGSATSAGAEKRFELFTRNSVEPSLLRAARDAEDAHRRVSNSSGRVRAPKRAAHTRLALRPDVS